MSERPEAGSRTIQEIGEKHESAVGKPEVKFDFHLTPTEHHPETHLEQASLYHGRDPETGRKTGEIVAIGRVRGKAYTARGDRPVNHYEPVPKSS